MRVLMAVKVLHYGNSALNPIIYSVRNRRFNRAFKGILLRLVCRKMKADCFGINNSTSRKTQQTRVDSTIMKQLNVKGSKTTLRSLSQDEKCTSKLM